MLKITNFWKYASRLSLVNVETYNITYGDYRQRSSTRHQGDADNKESSNSKPTEPLVYVYMRVVFPACSLYVLCSVCLTHSLA